MRYGTNHFVNFTKACDYYRDQNEFESPRELAEFVKAKIEEGEICTGKPDVPVGGRLLLVDNDCRYAIEEET